MRKIIAFLLVGLALGVISASVFAEEISLTVLSPREGSETFGGRAIEIKVRADLDPNYRSLEVRAEQTQCEVSQKGTFYSCTVEVPGEGGTKTFTITAAAKWEIGVGTPSYQEVTRTSTATLTLNVTNSLYLELVYPNPTGPTNLTDKKHIKAKLWFPERDRQYDISTIVPADINGGQANFVWDPAQGLFVAEYDLERFERGVPLELKISLLGDVSGSETFYPVLAAEGVFGEREKFPVEMVAGMVGTGAMAVVIAVWFFAFRKKRAEGREELEVKRERLMKLMKLEEIDFYKRRITEDEFKKRRFERQEELNEVNAKLEALGGKAKAGALEQKTA